IALGAFIYGFIFWYRTEKYNFGRGTIVPQYEPPQNLRPAMAEVMVKEKITDKAWPATIVDLAVRGYVKITAEKSWFRTNYQIEKIAAPSADATLEDYEKKFLELLLGNRGYFSTKEFRHRGNAAKREFVLALRNLRKELYQEIETETGAYVIGPTREIKKTLIWSTLFFLSLFLLPITIAIAVLNFQSALLIWTIVVASLALWSFIKYEARLSKEGQILKEDWLGFKLYLATAEKYRLQNLTPDLFEKFLPYAIIFSVEKKWGRAFAHLSMAPPNWYGSIGSVHSASPSVNGVGGFSAAAFSASFASSFTSAFSSSAGSGASGGGGSAGGGGGGGGG
ncbi:MAG: hypothetical protein AAB871_02855, partial [Patescibacteria group bacterium]